MKPLFVSLAALGCASLAGLSAYAGPGSAPSDDTLITVAGSGDGAGLPGLPGGRAGKSGRELAREYAGRRAQSDPDDQRLADYCIELLRRGRAPGGSDMRPTDCIDLFIALDIGRSGGRYGQAGQDGEPGQPGIAGGRGADGRDGASAYGGTGGKGGRAGSGAGGGAGGPGGAGIGGTGGNGGRGGNSY